MARQVRDSRLETREARARLKQRDEPYWRLIHEGLHLGYRKRVRGGVWMVRVYSSEGRYVKKVLGRADDNEDANGNTVLSFREAQGEALKMEASESDPLPSTYTVADALREYLVWYKGHKKPYAYHQAELKAQGSILPVLGEIPVAELTPKRLRQWLEGLVTQPPRLRTGRFSNGQKHRDEIDPRARRATANRTLTVLKAALNRAYQDGKIKADDAWRRVKPFRNVDAPKVRYLSIDESTRLINACEPDFRPLAQAALLTGCRYGELVGMVCHDFNPDAGCITVRESKSGKPRHVPLTEEGQRFFERSTAGRPGGEVMFSHRDGTPWGNSHQQRPLNRACEVAGIEPAISFHVLRHTYGSLLAMRGVPLQVIAEALGHADTRITSCHYAHLMPSYVADTIRKHLPNFGTERDNVVRLRAVP
jgi:integrase